MERITGQDSHQPFKRSELNGVLYRVYQKSQPLKK